MLEIKSFICFAYNAFWSIPNSCRISLVRKRQPTPGLVPVRDKMRFADLIFLGTLGAVRKYALHVLCWVLVTRQLQAHVRPDPFGF